MNEDLNEIILYDALHSITENAKLLCNLVNAHGTDADKKAYQNGVYSVAIKLQIVLGTDGIERGKARYEEQSRRLEKLVRNTMNPPNSVIPSKPPLPCSGGLPPISDENGGNAKETRTTLCSPTPGETTKGAQ